MSMKYRNNSDGDINDGSKLRNDIIEIKINVKTLYF